MTHGSDRKTIPAVDEEIVMGTRFFSIFGTLQTKTGYQPTIGVGAHADDLPDDDESAKLEIARRVGRHYGAILFK